MTDRRFSQLLISDHPSKFIKLAKIVSMKTEKRTIWSAPMSKIDTEPVPIDVSRWTSPRTRLSSPARLAGQIVGIDQALDTKRKLLLLVLLSP